MKKAIIFKNHTDKPYLERSKINKGIVEFINPTKSAFLKHVPLSDVGKAVHDEIKKIYFEPKYKIIKKFFGGGAHRYWMSIETPKLNVIIKKDFKLETQTTVIHYSIIEVEGNENDIDNFFNNVFNRIKDNLLSDIILKDEEVKTNYLKDNKNITIYNKL